MSPDGSLFTSSRPRTGPASLNEGPPDELVPAIVSLRRITTVLDAMLALEQLPRRVRVLLAAWAVEKPQAFAPAVVYALMASIPPQKLRRAVGLARAEALLSPPTSCAGEAIA